MDYIIRKIKKSEYFLLKDFLYEAVFVPEGAEVPPKSVVDLSELQVYIRDFGKFKDDIGFVAETENKIIGAIWARIMNDYGHIDEATPSLAVSLYKEYRSRGIGTALMEALLSAIKEKEYKKISLSVQKENYAVKLYKNLGFEIFKENDEEYIMVKYF